MNTKTDLQLKNDIEEELRWDPKVNAAQVGVSVDKGAVTLLGSVDTYPEKWAAEAATKRVHGVCTVAQDLHVKVLTAHQRNDAELAGSIQSALKWDVLVPDDVAATVKDGFVTLTGQVTWNFQRDGAVRAVGQLAGVTGVFNQITLKVKPTEASVRDQVKAALYRQARTDTKSIDIAISGSKVTLSGHASSWPSIEDAQGAAWGAPGVTEVVDHIKMAMTILPGPRVARCRVTWRAWVRRCKRRWRATAAVEESSPRLVRAVPDPDPSSSLPPGARPGRRRRRPRARPRDHDPAPSGFHRHVRFERPRSARDPRAGAAHVAHQRHRHARDRRPRADPSRSSGRAGRRARAPGDRAHAYAREEDRRLALEAGFQANLPKPLSSDALLKLIGELTRANRA